MSRRFVPDFFGKGRRRSAVVVADVLVTVASLFASWLLRASFPDMLFTIYRVFLFMPYVLFTRLLVNVVMEHYRLSYVNLHLTDIIRLYVHQFFPTLIFLILRFGAPVPDLRMPLSMIGIEYVFTVGGMVLARILVVQHRPRGNETASQRGASGLLICRLTDRPTAHAAFVDAQRMAWSPVAVVTPDAIDADLDFHGIRVFGGLDALRALALEHHDVAYLGLTQTLSQSERIEVLTVAAELGLRCQRLGSGEPGPYRLQDLGRRQVGEARENLPVEVASYWADRTVCLRGTGGVLQSALRSVLGANGATIEERASDDQELTIDLAPFEYFTRFSVVGATAPILDAYLASQERDRMPGPRFMPIQVGAETVLPAPDLERQHILLCPNLATDAALCYGVPTERYEPPEALAELICTWIYHVEVRRRTVLCYGHTREALDRNVAAFFGEGVQRAPLGASPQDGSPTEFYRLVEIPHNELGVPT